MNETAGESQSTNSVPGMHWSNVVPSTFVKENVAVQFSPTGPRDGSNTSSPVLGAAPSPRRHRGHQLRSALPPRAPVRRIPTPDVSSNPHADTQNVLFAAYSRAVVRVGTTLEAATAGDRALVDAVRAGEAEAFSALYRAHVGAVRAAVRDNVHDPEGIADVVQDTFARALERLPSLRDPDRFRPGSCRSLVTPPSITVAAGNDRRSTTTPTPAKCRARVQILASSRSSRNWPRSSTDALVVCPRATAPRSRSSRGSASRLPTSRSRSTSRSARPKWSCTRARRRLRDALTLELKRALQRAGLRDACTALRRRRSAQRSATRAGVRRLRRRGAVRVVAVRHEWLILSEPFDPYLTGLDRLDQRARQRTGCPIDREPLDLRAVRLRDARSDQRGEQRERSSSSRCWSTRSRSLSRRRSAAARSTFAMTYQGAVWLHLPVVSPSEISRDLAAHEREPEQQEEEHHHQRARRRAERAR